MESHNPKNQNAAAAAPTSVAKASDPAPSSTFKRIYFSNGLIDNKYVVVTDNTANAENQVYLLNVNDQKKKEILDAKNPVAVRYTATHLAIEYDAKDPDCIAHQTNRIDWYDYENDSVTKETDRFGHLLSSAAREIWILQRDSFQCNYLINLISASNTRMFPPPDTFKQPNIRMHVTADHLVYCVPGKLMACPGYANDSYYGNNHPYATHYSSPSLLYCDTSVDGNYFYEVTPEYKLTVYGRSRGLKAEEITSLTRISKKLNIKFFQNFLIVVNADEKNIFSIDLEKEDHPIEPLTENAEGVIEDYTIDEDGVILFSDMVAPDQVHLKKSDVLSKKVITKKTLSECFQPFFPSVLIPFILAYYNFNFAVQIQEPRDFILWMTAMQLKVVQDTMRETVERRTAEDGTVLVSLRYFSHELDGMIREIMEASTADPYMNYRQKFEEMYARSRRRENESEWKPLNFLNFHHCEFLWDVSDRIALATQHQNAKAARAISLASTKDSLFHTAAAGTAAAGSEETPVNRPNIG